MRSLRFSNRWLAGGIALLVLVAALSLRPQGVPLPGGIWEVDKLAHALAYFTLAAWFGGVFHKKSYPGLAGALIAFGAGLEGLQGAMPDRYADLFDVLANTSGVGLGLTAGALGLGGWCEWIENRLHERHA